MHKVPVVRLPIMAFCDMIKKEGDKMKTLIRLFSHCCIYTVLITLGFCVFIKASGELTDAAIRIDQYLILFAFSALLALTELLFLIPVLPSVAKWLMHYTLSCVVFCVVFSSMGKLAVSDFSRLLAAILVYSAIYVVCVFVFLLFRLIVRKFDKTNPIQKTKNKKQKENEKPYKNLFQ